MSKEQRKHPRRKLHIEVELGFPSGEKQIVRTRDVSECGIFIVLDRLRRPVIGEVVTVKICDDSDEKHDDQVISHAVHRLGHTGNHVFGTGDGSGHHAVDNARHQEQQKYQRNN